MSSLYPWKNLVFEGGGVKGVAHVAAVQYLQEQGVLKDIQRVAGTSAGAIQAVPLALRYSLEEILQQLRGINFYNFKDGSLLGNIDRLLSEFGLYKGNFLKEWIGGLIEKKLGSSQATFKDLQHQKAKNGFYDLYLVGTNVSRGISEVFSHETYPDMPIVDAVRISMSFPFFFRAVQFQGDYYCDGGLLRNYPLRIFDEERYLFDPKAKREVDFYQKINSKYQTHYIFNEETLGFRVDTEEEMAVYEGKAAPPCQINDIFDYTKRVISVMSNAQDLIHLNSDDWRRTVYISSKGIGTLDFDISPTDFETLCLSGADYAKDFLHNWTEFYLDRNILRRMVHPPDWFTHLPLRNIGAAAQKFGLDLFLVSAVVFAESGGNPLTTQYFPRYQYLYQVERLARISGVSAETEKIHQKTSWGLMRIMGGVVRELGFEGPLPQLCDIGINLHWGCLKLKQCLEKHDHHIPAALAAYHSGSARKKANGEYRGQEFVDVVREWIFLLKNSLKT